MYLGGILLCFGVNGLAYGSAGLALSVCSLECVFLRVCVFV